MDYPPLDRNQRQIRLIHLQPAAGFLNPLTCRLSVVDLDYGISDYEALSYVWGDPTDATTIRVDEHPVKITITLDTILRYLRFTDRERVLWIDQLSIDQLNDQERSHQVGIMGLVYSQATNVVVWLGVKDRDSKQATRYFWCNTPTIAETNETCSSYPRPRRSVGFNPKKTQKAVASFLDSSWWQRIWTLQEVVLARHHTFQRGKYIADGCYVLQTMLQFQRLAINPWRLDSVGRKRVNAVGRLEKIKWLASARTEKSFFQISKYCVDRGATDPRDKIYALLSVISDGDRAVIIPDYSLDTRQVYMNVFLDMLRNTRSLEGLSYSERKVDRQVNSSCLPSWVPDWNQAWDDNRIADSLCLYEASAGRPVMLKTCNQEGQIILRGMRIDRLKSTKSPYDFRSVHACRRILSQMHGDKHVQQPLEPYMNSKLTIEEAYWLTLCNDLLHIDPTKPCRLKSDTDSAGLFGSRNWWINMCRGDVVDVNYFFMESFNDAYLRYNRWQRLFISKTGYLGWCPIRSEPGDLIVVLAGGKVPYIIREKPRADCDGTTYEFIGNAYVQGIMDGEAFAQVGEHGEGLEDFALV